ASSLPPGAVATEGFATSLNDLAPPPEGQGVQLTIPAFDVPYLTEVQKDFYMKLPVDHDVMINRIQFSYPEGCHHCTLFKTDDLNVPDHVEDTFDAIAYQNYAMVAGAQAGELDWKLPDGVGEPMHAHEQLCLQVHFVNALTQKTPGGKGWVKINLWFADPKAITSDLGSYFGINQNLDILPHTTATYSKDVDLSQFGVKDDVKIIAMTGHFHSRGRTFLINRINPDGSLGQELYRSENWDEPPFRLYDPPITLKAGEKLRYTTTYVNNSDITITFGPHVETQEHSNLFMYFYPGPADGKPINDVYASGTTQILQ
ncbi:MAG TPA: hypothetical protein V6D47_16040, partial [Oscillatoriaceae cyanobacterium]